MSLPSSSSSLSLATPLLVVHAVSRLKMRARRPPSYSPPPLGTPEEWSLYSSSLQPEQVKDLPPQDRGFAAWSFVFAAMIMEAVIWSPPFAFGVLIEDYLRLPGIASNPNASNFVPLVGTLSSGIMYCSGILVYPYMSCHRNHIRPLMWLGMTLCWVSLLIASYSHKLHQFVILQGGLYGIGGGLAYPPCILYMSDWFFERRGLANGILFAGTPIGGLILPFILPSLVKSYGLLVTLRILGVATLVLLLPCMIFIRPRLREQDKSRSFFTITASAMILRDRAWWILVAMNVIQGFAFSIPSIYIPTFSSALDLRNALVSLSVALLNGSAAAGPVLVGFLSDHFTPWPIAFIISILTLFCTLVLWGAVGNVVGTMLFAVTFGFFTSGWCALWASFTRRISREDPALSMSMFGVLMLTRGLGNILSTPISTALSPVESLSTVDDGSRRGFTFEMGRFTRLIVFIGVCYAAATLVSVLGWRLEKTRGRSTSRRSTNVC